MDLVLSDRAQPFQARLAFINDRIYPAELIHHQQMRESGDPSSQPPILEALNSGSCARELWNLLHPDPEWGSGLTNALRLAAGPEEVRKPTIARGELRPWATPPDLAVTSSGSRS